MVTTMAVVGDIIAPRERRRYQGYFGAVFGVSTVLGPLLGGFFVDNLSWRWIFYVNLPIGALAFAVIGTAFHARTSDVRHLVDYLGASVLAGALSAIVLFTSLGGTTYPWLSPPTLVLTAVGVALLVLFKQLPPAVHAPYVKAFAASLHPVFLAASGIALCALALTWLLREVPLCRTARAEGVGESFASPRDASSERELERIVGSLMQHDERTRTYEGLISRSGVALAPEEAWLLGRRPAHDAEPTPVLRPLARALVAEMPG